MKHVKLYSPRQNNLSSGVIDSDVGGIRQKEVIKRLLARNVIAKITPYADSYIRVAPSIVYMPDNIT